MDQTSVAGFFSVRKKPDMNLIKKMLGRGRLKTDSPSGSLNARSLSTLPDQNDRDPERADLTALAYALRVFERYYAKKTKFLYEQLPPRKKIVFDLVPLLLHLDAVGLLGCDDACQMSPHGIFGYRSDRRTESSFAAAFPDCQMPPLLPRASFDPSLPIKSLTLIGSLGSIAQNPKSDFDYWICFDQSTFSRESSLYFEEKLAEIERWADEFAGAEVHFFPLDLNAVRNEEFGVASGESSGTAQVKLLKEEYYRSMTLVAGQVPVWWVMPPGVSDEEYDRLLGVVKSSGRLDNANVVDMGNVQNISLGEFYGAAIWQLNKTMGSPFKSVIKMALLEEYLYNHGRSGLLCDELKHRLLANEEEIEFLDSYVLMFDRASRYLTENQRFEDLDLLRRALYLKSGVKLALADHRRTDLDRKKQIMVKLIRQWGWSHKMVAHLNAYHYWTYRDAHAFSQETNAFIIRAYKNVSAKLNSQNEQVGLVISQRDLTVLGRKLFIFYSRRANKVDSTRSVIETPPKLSGLTLQPRINHHGTRIWAAHRALLSREAVAAGKGKGALLKAATNLAEVLIWLVNNSLYDSTTYINLNTGRDELNTHCTVPDIQKLLKTMRDFFPSYKHSEVDEEELLQKPRLVRMLLVINLEESDRTTRIVQTGVCYQNNWGEIFFKGYEGGSQEGLKIAREFLRKNFAYDPVGALSNFKLFMPDRLFKRILGPRLNKYFGLKVA